MRRKASIYKPIIFSTKEIQHLNDATKFELEALDISRQARWVTYQCPKCQCTFSTVWLFPDTDMMFTCDICGSPLVFKSNE